MPLTRSRKLYADQHGHESEEGSVKVKTNKSSKKFSIQFTISKVKGMETVSTTCAYMSIELRLEGREPLVADDILMENWNQGGYTFKWDVSKEKLNKLMESDKTLRTEVFYVVVKIKKQKSNDNIKKWSHVVGTCVLPVQNPEKITRTGEFVMTLKPTNMDHGVQQIVYQIKVEAEK